MARERDNAEEFVDQARKFVQKKEMEELGRRRRKFKDYEGFFGKDHPFSRRARKKFKDEEHRIMPPSKGNVNVYDEEE